MIELNTEIIVEDLDEKVRLDVFLSEETNWTRSQIKLQIDNDRVFVNGKKQKAGFLIKNGDKISVSFSKDVIEINAEAENIPLDIVFEDENFAIINKPQKRITNADRQQLIYKFANILVRCFITYIIFTKRNYLVIKLYTIFVNSTFIYVIEKGIFFCF